MENDLMAKKPTYEELERRVKELEINTFQHQQTKETLKRITDEQTVLLGAVPAMIFWINKEGEFIRVNEPFAAALKKSPDEINRKSLFDLYPEDQSRKFHNDNLEVIESGNSKKNIEESVQTPAGTMWVCTDKIPYRDKEGNVVGIIGYSVDITELKRAEEALRKSEEKLDAMLCSIGDHMSMMDKDLNIIWANESAKKVFAMILLARNVLRLTIEEKNLVNHILALCLRHFRMGRFIKKISRR
jgi:PAS domain S-box-containing protein